MSSDQKLIFSLKRISSLPDGTVNIKMYKVNEEKLDRYILKGTFENYKIPRKFHFQIPTKIGKQIVDSLELIDIKIIPDFLCGCDGTTYEFEIIRGFNNIKIKWWVDIPKQWQSLKKITNQIINLVEKKVQQSQE